MKGSPTGSQACKAKELCLTLPGCITLLKVHKPDPTG